MSRLPKIAIVGRPNVGKSALFNCIVDKRIAIVDEQEGVTRDRLYGKTDFFGKEFEVIDTGGMLSSDPFFGEAVTEQAKIAVAESDGIILVVDGRVGVMPLDMEVAKIIRKTKKPVVLAINKFDSGVNESVLQLFSPLGIQPMVGVSALHRYHIAEMLEQIVPRIEREIEEEIEEKIPHVAIIGRPNVGKSYLLNTLLGEERCIVSPVAGTTRDSIDTPISFEEDPYILIDTAGIKRKPKEQDVVEKFAAVRTKRAIDRADVCLLMVDCQSGITSEEKKIATDIEKALKPCVILLNKWDLVHNFRMEHVMKGIEMEVPFLANSPKLIVSAKTGRNIEKIFPMVKNILASNEKRIPTHQLNKALKGWIEQYHPPAIGGKRLKIYYMSQVDVCPPQFVLFVNAVHLVPNGYIRYLENQIRKQFSFEGIPFVIRLRGKTDVSRNRTKPSLHRDRDLSALEEVVQESEEDFYDEEMS